MNNINYVNMINSLKDHRQQRIAKTTNNHDNGEMNLFDFSRMYKIGQIPIMDFIVVYILLCILNALYFDYNYKFMLVATIPLTILTNVIFMKNIKLTGLLMTIFVVSILYLFYINRTTKVE